MPHLDAAFNPVQDTDKTAHKCVWVSLSSCELTRQLRACTDEFAEWEGAEPTHAFRYADGMGWALEVARIAAGLDDEVWTSTYFGWTAVSPTLEMAFEHVEKRPYPLPQRGDVRHGARLAGASKVDRTKLDAAKLVEAGLYTCKTMPGARRQEVCLLRVSGGCRPASGRCWCH